MDGNDRETLSEMIENIGTAMLVTENGDGFHSRPMKEKYIATAARYGNW